MLSAVRGGRELWAREWVWVGVGGEGCEVREKEVVRVGGMMFKVKEISRGGGSGGGGRVMSQTMDGIRKRASFSQCNSRSSH